LKKILSTLIDSFWVCFGVDKEYKRVVLNCKYGFENEKVLLRILKDLGAMSAKNYASFQEKIESVSKQATGWSNAGVS